LKEEANLRKTLETSLASKAPAGEANDENELSQKEFANVMAEALEKTTAANTALILKEVAKKVGTTDVQIGELKNVMTNLLAGISVGQAKSKHKDFDVYAEDASAILKATQGLSPEDAYLLAKVRKASTQPDKDALASERPTEAVTVRDSNATRVPEQHENVQQLSSRSIFKKAVSDAIDKQVAKRQNVT